MMNRGRGYSQTSEWDMREDYNDSLYDTREESNSSLDHCRLYITNIPKGLNDEGLRSAFSKFGTLIETYLSRDPNKKYGLVRYETPGEAKLAMMKMNKTEPLKLHINVAYKGKKVEDRHRKKYQDRSNNGQDWQSNNDDSFGSKSRNTSRVHETTTGTTNGDNMDDLLKDEYGFSESLDPELTMELESIKLEQLKLREEQLICKHRLILLKQKESRQVPTTTMSNRCILPDGKIVVRNVVDKNADLDVSHSAGAGDSNETTVCCSCKNKAKSSWDPRLDDGTSTPSTCVLCSEDNKRDKSKDKKSEYSTKVVDSKTIDFTTTPSKTTKKSDCSKVTESVSKKSDATSKKELKRCAKCSEVTCELKYSDFYTDSDDEDETNRLIQLRNADYMDIVSEDLKLVIALAGYPKSKMRLRQMEQFQRSLTEVIDMQLKAGLLKRVPSFLDYYLNRGALVCICKDGETRDWMVRISPGLQERMKNNLVLLRARVKRLCLAVLKIPKLCWPATAQDAFKLLQYFNPTLKTNLWKIYAQKLEDDVEFTSFLIDRVSGEIIRGPTFKNVIDYSQMEFELTGYTEIYYECLLSGMEEDLRSVASRVKLLDELRSAETTPRNQSEVSIKAIEVHKEEIKEESPKEDDVNVKKELESSLQKDILKKLKDVKYISDKDEVLVWSDETNNYGTDIDTEKNVKENNIASTSGVAMSDKTESFIESNDNLISRSSNLNIDSNRGIAYHRRTNYLHVEPELKVAITLEGYPQNKLEGTHIRRLKHLFKEYLHKDMKLQRFANLIIPKFQDIYLSNGAVIYICDSLETKDYLTEVLPKFINSTGLKLTFRDIKSLVRYTRIVMRLPKEYAHVESLEILLKLQNRYPGLKPDCWKYYSDVAGKQKRQFGVDPESLEVIKSPDFDATYEGEKLTFRIIDRQKRDVSFEEVNKELEDVDKGQRDLVLKSMYLPIDPEIMAAPLTRIRTNHYSDLIADDLKLYVGPSNYPESRIDEVLFHTIKRTLENIVLEALDKGEITEDSLPKFHDMYLFDGVIFIICACMESRTWIEQNISIVNTKLHIHLKSTEFRGAVGIISMVVKTEKDTDDVIAILQEQNPRLRTKYWRKISTVRTRTKLDVVLQIDKLSAQVITSPSFNKFIGANAVQFKLGHLQSLLKPKSSLEELSKIHCKKIDKKTSDASTLGRSKSKVSMQGPKKSFEDLKNELKKEYPALKPEQWSVLAQHEKTDHNICDLEIDETSANIIKSKDFELNMGDQKVYFYSENKIDSDLDPVIIEPESPKSIENELLMPDQQGYHKIILKIPLDILPENKDDVNIIFDLLEDKNPGLNTELWQIFTETAYPSNGKFTVYIDKQSIAVLQGKNFDPTIGGEKLKFYF
ncbi:vreteno isoform X1 [Anticarsia gemmatalis]|uniref:vreteno isoform X1 n=1 Tax=Anticarsia gemmatalis TaxID=129554 RepID=UPI003F75C838